MIETFQAARPSWNPLRCTGLDLPTNLAVLVKVLAFVVLLTNHVKILPDPWLPFLPFIDRLPPLLFQKTLQTLFLVAALAVVFNRRIRLASLVLGVTMLVAVLSSKAYYGNNKTFCGLMFLLAGLYQPGGPPFLRWQLALTYFGAGLNKALDPDWHTGIFFENWAVNRLHQPWYLAFNALLPSLVLAKFLCWSTIVTELAEVPLLLVPRLYYWGVLANILFQASLLLFTGTTFTLFFYSMSAASLAFVVWPSAPVPVSWNPESAFSQRVRRLFAWWDLDGRFQWTPSPGALRLEVANRVYTGFRAVRILVLLNPVTWFVLFSSIAVLDNLPDDSALLRRLIVTAALVLLLPPLAWILDQLSRPARSRVLAPHVERLS